MKYGTKINFNLSPELRQRATKAARELRMTRSQLFRTALEEAISLHEQWFTEPKRDLYYIRLKPSEAKTLARIGYDLKPDLTDVVKAEEIQGFEECIAALDATIARDTDESILST